MIRNGGYQYEPTSLHDELAQYTLDPDQREQLEQLYLELNGSSNTVRNADDW